MLVPYVSNLLRKRQEKIKKEQKKSRTVEEKKYWYSKEKGKGEVKLIYY